MKNNISSSNTFWRKMNIVITIEGLAENKNTRTKMIFFFFRQLVILIYNLYYMLYEYTSCMFYFFIIIFILFFFYLCPIYYTTIQYTLEWSQKKKKLYCFRCLEWVEYFILNQVYLLCYYFFIYYDQQIFL